VSLERKKNNHKLKEEILKALRELRAALVNARAKKARGG
jgi:ribosomal protein L29